eukprot:7688920-Pyramimonas_sp.AAC.1
MGRPCKDRSWCTRGASQRDTALEQDEESCPPRALERTSCEPDTQRLRAPASSAFPCPRLEEPVLGPCQRLVPG